MEKLTIGIIHNEPLPPGAPNWESSADVLAQVEAIEVALDELGHPHTRMAFTRDLAGLANCIRDQEVDVAFNLCESLDEDPMLIGHAAAVLELLGVPFTGSSAMALLLTTDKLLVKRLLVSCDIPTPAFFSYEGADLPPSVKLNFPVIIKPRWQDASIGIDQESVVNSRKELGKKIEAFYQQYGPLVIEEYIHGREFNISLFGFPKPQALPLAEIDFSHFPKDLHRIVGYRAKWDVDSFEYQHTQRLFPDNLSLYLQRTMRRIAHDCFQLCGLRDYARVDLRLDDLNRLHVLEVNANPCLSPDAGFAAAMAIGKVNYTDMVRQLIRFASTRKTA